ncbi:Rpb7-binding protein seb1 [Stagonosporopsis vannaccii]|nr:Rpb7-binding protein seb1 [Stagonosporopsis vannaccii]
MAAMDELETLLQSLQALKAPGVTPTKVKAITAICVENIQSDSTIIQKILQQLQNSPATHKLGVLYVVDSVTRQWVEKAKAAGQQVSRSAAPGTFAAGVQKMTDVLPAVMNDLVQHAPDAQKEKISKLLDIWQRGQTFPLDMLATFKQRVNGNQQHAPPAPRSPPKGNSSAPAPHTQTNAQLTAAPLPPPSFSQSPQDPSALFAAISGFVQPNGQTNAAPPAPPFLQNMVPPPPPPGFVPPPPPAAIVQPVMPPPPPAGMNDLANQILQAMSAGSIAPDQAIQVLNALAVAQNGGATLPPSQPVVAPQAQSPAQVGTQNGSLQPRFEQNDLKMRDRSRSPDYQRRVSPSRRSPPNRRESPVYGAYDPSAVADGNASNLPDRNDRGRGRGKARGSRNDRNEYRQRTPPGQRRQPSPPKNVYGQSRYIEWDQSLPRDNIRVLSRTLFVGGAGGTEGEIRAIFSRFGRVQTCIVNQDKRHAFVKMLTRPDAVAAKEGMDSLQDPAAQSKARQTRWGVGFGPRDCSDYSTGISVIPISRLTDADRKWALTAEHGGTGGRPLEGGMVLEEPDIEIGAGVSSKAISKRVPTDGGRGGRGGFGGRGGMDNGPKLRKQEQRAAHDPRHVSPRAEQGVAVPPAVPGFGFQLPGFQAR